MPNPIIVDRYRAQVVIPALTGLPEDSVVNTFGFRNDGLATQQTMADAIQARLTDFYTAVVAQTGQAVEAYLNGNLLGPVAKIKIYDLGEAPPRTVIERDLGLVLGAGGAMPPEVAICCSFYGTRNLPRQRGRIFLGPVHSSALALTGSRVLLSTNARLTLAHAMRRLSQVDAGNAARWHVISPTSADSHEVTAGWVDNAPDTQRRRGHAATLRHTWDAAGVAEIAEQ